MKSATQPRNCFMAIASKQKISWVKIIAGCYHRNSSRRWDDQILIGTLHLDTMRVKRKREMDETFLLYDVYTALLISDIPDILKSTSSLKSYIRVYRTLFLLSENFGVNELYFFWDHWPTDPTLNRSTRRDTPGPQNPFFKAAKSGFFPHKY